METYITKKEGEKLYLFKKDEKIGEVSPEATWVKEGDEFDEYQSYIDRRINNIDDVKDWTDAEYDDITVCKVKGPCGHFH